MRQDQSSMSKTECFRHKRQLFERLEKENKRDDTRPGSKKSVRFLNGIWEQPVRYNNIGKWF